MPSLLGLSTKSVGDLEKKDKSKHALHGQDEARRPSYS